MHRMSETRPLSDGAVRLDRYIYRLRITQQAFANKIGVTAPCVNRWLRGMTKPSEASAAMLEKVAGVPADSWHKPRRAAS
jgi:DNA-binding transcriptional regulator YiaG